ncbi:MAG: DUF262 domain-containing protein [Prevotellaceae bacterium]|nr:DUF262 domain-containing protein [Prevotellaceae bacterium]
MQAKETRLQEIIEGTKQFMIPLFQRAYSWTIKEWKVLWNDIAELADMEVPRIHFMGSIVTMPTVSVPHGVAKFLLIDGQQRLTTIFIILAVLRDKAHEIKNTKLADKIHNILLVNQYEEGSDHYKLLPTQINRKAFQQIIEGLDNDTDPIIEAYYYFSKEIDKSSYELEKILKILTDTISVVSIVLDMDDNPYLVFESLNAKGRTLTHADLIKNYFFMRIPLKEQEDIYKRYWLPMHNSLNADEQLLSKYIWHYMMKDGGMIRETYVYYALKDRVSEENAVSYIQDLHRYSFFYRNLIYPEYEKNKKLKRCFERLNRIAQTVIYPTLLFFYGEYDCQRITQEEFVELLTTIENYLLRRFVCEYKTNELNKIFPAVLSAIKSNNEDGIVETYRIYLSRKGYPKDSEFKSKLQTTKLYGRGDRIEKASFILENIEESYHHKEKVYTENIQVEHIMPQTLSFWWQRNLGEDWTDVHEELLDTIGNLTLTAYNPELSNADYNYKRNIYANSHIELNKYFAKIAVWNREQILTRSNILAEKAMQIWPYFGDSNAIIPEEKEVTGSSPRSLEILGEIFAVKNWRDVLEITLNTLADLEADKFMCIAQQLPTYISKDQRKFRAIRQLNNGYYIEVNQSANSIYRVCTKALQIVGLTPDDWNVNCEGGIISTPEPAKTESVNPITGRLYRDVKQKCIERVAQYFNTKFYSVNNSYYLTGISHGLHSYTLGVHFAVSKKYQCAEGDRYWLAYRPKQTGEEAEESYYAFGCGDENTIVLLPESMLKEHINEMHYSTDIEFGTPSHFHVSILVDKDKRVRWILPVPERHEIDITKYLLK